MSVTLGVFSHALCFFACATMAAQTDTVRPDARAVRLKTMWRIGGDFQTTIGTYGSALGDVNSDGYADFSVSRYRRGGTGVDVSSMVFLGGADSAGIMQAGEVPGYVLCRGDFWGTGHDAVVVCAPRTFRFAFAQTIQVHRTEGDTLDQQPATQFDTVLDSVDAHYVMVSSAAVADLDLDGYDDLVLAVSYSSVRNVFRNAAEFWIYRGGPDFSLSEPTAVLTDTMEQIGGYNTKVLIGDLDGDAHSEIIGLTRHYRGSGTVSRVVIWWGDGSISSYAPVPDRASFNKGFLGLVACDVDGDGRADLVGGRGRAFLSSSGKDARTRSWDTTDADVAIELVGDYPQLVGPLNDSTGRFDMLGATLGPGSGSTLAPLSGSPTGPNARYEAYWSTELEGAKTSLGYDKFVPVGDINGDNWPDVLYRTYGWGGYDMGIAAIILGGRYIPRDFEYADVPSAARERNPLLVTVRPNPAALSTTIEWKDGTGEIASIDIVDALGRLHHTCPVALRSRTHRIDCSTLAQGIYFLVLRDRLGQPQTSTSLLVQ